MNDPGQKISCIGLRILKATLLLPTLGCESLHSGGFKPHDRLTPHTSAKHLHSPDEQLYSLAGSLGYVAPEVLKNSGHGKPVDIWAIGWGSFRCFSSFKVNDDVP